jgi:hypothetical protein
MLRGFSMCGLGGTFLVISPNLRHTVLSGIDSGVNSMAMYAPYSYIGAVAAGMIVVMIALSRGAQPR